MVGQPVDGCAPSTVAYIQDLKLPATSLLRFIPQPVRALGLWPYLAPLFLKPLSMMRGDQGTLKLQLEMARQTLKNSKIDYHEIKSTEDLNAALDEFKQALLFVKATESLLVVDDEKTGEINRYTVLAPYVYGSGEHAMIAVGTLTGDDDRKYLLVIDPASGQLLPAEYSQSVEDSIIAALVID